MAGRFTVFRMPKLQFPSADPFQRMAEAFAAVERFADPFQSFGKMAEILIERHKAACETLGIEPGEHNPYGEMPMGEFLSQAEAWRQLQEDVRTGRANPAELLKVTRTPRRVRPGRKARTSAEYAEYAIDLVEKWREWRDKGYSQQDFADFHGWESRTPLTDAIRWYRDQFGNDSI